MYAILETGGKQYRVEEGDVITVEKLPGEAGDTVEFDKVLLVSDGADVKVGTPYLDGTKITGQIVETGKGKKIIVFKYKAKKDYRKKQGHRQPFTAVEITSLTGKAPTKKAAAPAKEEEKKAIAEDNATAQESKEDVKVSASMKKDELLAVAKELGVEVDAKATKAVIIEAIENASK